LQSLKSFFVADERIEDRKDVPPELEDAEKAAALIGLAFRFAVPLGEDVGRHFDVATQLLRRMAAEEEAVEKGRFAVRVFQLVLAFDFFHQRPRRSKQAENGVYGNGFPCQEPACGFEKKD
jgi:hypothetical protein